MVTETAGIRVCYAVVPLQKERRSIQEKSCFAEGMHASTSVDQPPEREHGRIVTVPIPSPHLARWIPVHTYPVHHTVVVRDRVKSLPCQRVEAPSNDGLQLPCIDLSQEATHDAVSATDARAQGRLVQQPQKQEDREAPRRVSVNQPEETGASCGALPACGAERAETFPPLFLRLSRFA